MSITLSVLYLNIAIIETLKMSKQKERSNPAEAFFFMF